MKLKVAAISLIIVNQLISQTDTIRLSELEVNANRISSKYKDHLRVVQIIDKKDISQLPVKTLSEILDYIVSADIRQRGFNNVQADISLRGGNYEQTLVMINGIPVNDPQTGHHNLNIPIHVNLIERIEVLTGGDARRYGANAFAGAINIVTKEMSSNKINTTITGGDFKYFSGEINGNVKTKDIQHLFSLAHQQSDGYRPNTDFNNSQLTWQMTYKTEHSITQSIASLENKAFGAQSFYTPKFPNQYEQTKALFSSISHKQYGEKVIWTTQLFYRQHHDRFELFRHDLPADQIPGWYKHPNYHMTRTAGGQTFATFNHRLGKTTTGADLRYEHIFSNVLGESMNDTIKAPFEKDGFFTKKAEKYVSSVFIDHEYSYKKIILSGGLMATYLSTNHFFIYPGIDFGFNLHEHWKYFASANRSVRMPTYTELYYKDAANEGNIYLKPEEANNIETGIKFQNKLWNVQMAIFYRNGINIIDWVRLSATDKWHSENISTVNTMGGELLIYYFNHEKYLPDFIHNIQAGYTHINIEKQTGNYFSKYALDVLRHKFFISNTYTYDKLSFTWKLLYHERMGTYTEFPSGNEAYYKPYVTIDASIYYQLKNVNLFINGTNLLNTYYYDIANIPMPGRWVRGGLNLSL